MRSDCNNFQTYYGYTHKGRGHTIREEGFKDRQTTLNAAAEAAKIAPTTAVVVITIEPEF